ncbi:MAG: hypothetical protein J6X37_06325, partial [Treponema sp.]|nr:hypothetical protein [Treponema sp.]
MFDIKIHKIESSAHENDGTFLQTPFWCQFKARHGWTYHRFEIEYTLQPLNASDKECSDGHNNEKQDAVSVKKELAVLNRSFAKGMFSIAYIPLFPKLPYECTPEELMDKAFDDEGDASALAGQEIITPETQTIEFAHFLSELAAALKTELPSNTIAIRFDPDVSFSSPEDRDLFNYGMKMVSYADRLKLRKNSVDIQPPDSTLVDLT